MNWKHLLAVVLIVSVAAIAFSADPGESAERAKAYKAYRNGNWKDALNIYKKLALAPKTDPLKVGDDLNMATQCLHRLNRVNELDKFREAVIKVHKDNWRLLQIAAQNYSNNTHYGYIVAGEFHRGRHRGGGRYSNAHAHDRVRSLQLMTDAVKAAEKEKNVREVAGFYLNFANMISQYRGYSQAWRLQYLTDITKLPDYGDGYGHYYYGRGKGAPVDTKGKPVLHYAPKSYKAAATDGERWRWLLMQAAELDPARTNHVRMTFANFLHAQFGVQTMAYYGRYFRGRNQDDDKDESGTYELHTLKENETIAKLATGIKRFALPDEFNFVKIYQTVADNKGYGEQPLNQLCQIFENRRQYPKAATYWRRNIKEHGPGHKNRKGKRLDQIVKNWGMFEPVMTQPAGQGATVDYRFRNGKNVSFTAHAIKVKTLLDDVKAYIKTKPRRLKSEQMNIGNIGWRLVYKNQAKYVGKKVAEWDLDLKPRTRHFDKRTTVSTPLQKAGAYLVTAKMGGGNVSRIVLWLDDTAIVKKMLNNGSYYFVADALTGKPIKKANVEFFGYWQKWVRNNVYHINIEQFAEFTDKDGQVFPTPKQMPSNHRWMIIARTDKGRFAYMGFTGVWYRRHYDHEYNQTKVFTITDRPVYRPKQKMKFKFWVRHAKYDRENTSDFADKTYTVRINNSKGEKVFDKKYKTDKWGGLNGEYDLPKEAMLGTYYIGLWNGNRRIGGNRFRVEEYKKPEFEVTIDAPTEPVMLGEKITATINAKYYFGAPVTKAKVKYKVQRYSYSANWYPEMYWDWFYGPGYWWFAYDYSWYPGWRHWGCKAPRWWWWGSSYNPPELVMENEVQVGPDGTVKVEIDTGVAKEMHGDTDHKYTITAEITDASRRTIVGVGNVMVARKPFKVYAWLDRGHYRVGDVIRADFNAQTLDKKGVKGKGKLKLFQIKYGKGNKPEETLVREWDLDTNDEGRADLQIKAFKAGQYRLSYTVTDAKDHKIEGGYVFVIAGPGFDGAGFRFDNIELVTDKKEYKPGDKIKLMINTNRTGGTVLLFTRPSNSVYLKPKVIRLTGKSAVEEIEITKKDMPNMFIEAVTISGGKVYSTVREVIVPPEKRVLKVKVDPSAKKYKPGEKANVKIKVTELNGEPFAGSLAVAMYDKSVEYISGGSNVPEIKAFFWKWRRRHYPRTESSLGRWFNQLLKQHEIGMGYLGVFGHSVADELKDEVQGDSGGDDAEGGASLKRQRGGKGGGYGQPTLGTATPRAPGARDSAPMEKAKNANRADKKSEGRAGGDSGKTAQPTVRKKFADTAYWNGALNTDKAGNATFDLIMPENLTAWKLRVWGMGHGTKVGQAEVEVVTTKNLLLRLQAPRFFVEKDEVVLSANIHNYLKNKKDVEAVLELDGGCLKAMSKPKVTLAVDANGEARVDWRVKVIKEGTAVVRMKALTDEESDAMEMSFPVYVHGMLKTESWSGALRPADKSSVITLNVPKERRINESRLEIRYSPTLAGAMVDALPYLVDYPHHTSDNELNRFLPTVMTQKILLDMKLDLAAIQKKRTNLNAQEIGDDKERAKQWKRFKRNPVFDQATVRDMVKAGVRKLTAMQLSSGAWGWFSGWGEHPSTHITAYVVHGLQMAKANDVAIVPRVLERGVKWLTAEQSRRVAWIKAKRPNRKAHSLDAFVFMVLTDAGVKNADMLKYLYEDRNGLAVYSKAMYGIALHKLAEKDKLAMVVKNIDQYLVQDDENQTAYLKLPQNNYWWYWYGSEYEAQAYYLKLLCRTDPKGVKASRLVKYLLNNRKHATYWNSPRDTSICVEAFAEYLKATGEHKPDMTVTIEVDGKKVKEVKINAENLFSFDNKLVMLGDAITTGKHKVEVKKTGKGPLYFNAYLTTFTLEDFIKKAGLEIKVDRFVYKMVKVKKTIKVQGARGQALDQKVEKLERRPVKNLDTLKSGDLIEVELVIQSKNDYEYIVFEDMKAAGFEAVKVRSGYSRNGLGAYMELRDEKVCFFVRRLARAKHSISYRLRAEIPGKFSALPTRAYAMYAPELKANSDEIKIKIVD
jgi:alpha-2-macroglobulin